MNATYIPRWPNGSGQTNPAYSAELDFDVYHLHLIEGEYYIRDTPNAGQYIGLVQNLNGIDKVRRFYFWSIDYFIEEFYRSGKDPNPYSPIIWAMESGKLYVDGIVDQPFGVIFDAGAPQLLWNSEKYKKLRDEKNGQHGLL